MEKRTLKKSGLKASMLGMGMMRLPLGEDGQVDMEHTAKMVDYLMQNGVNYFDTAYFYHGGNSESITGELLCSKYPRDSFVLTDKLPFGSCKNEDDVMRHFNLQMERLKTDYLDYYLIHGTDGKGWDYCKEHKIIDVFEKLKAKGLIRHIGFSFHGTPQGLRYILSDYDWDIYQVQLNYLDYYIHGYDKLYEVMKDFDIPCVIMEPLKGGTIAKLPDALTAPFRQANPDASIASWGLRWCGSLPEATIILSGMSSLEHVTDNVKTFSPFKPVNDDEIDVIKQVVKLINQRPVIPCTDCKYCIECPMNINIPQIFDIYNEYIRYENRGHSNWRYNINFDKSRMPTNCTKCGYCVQRCPQKIDIPAQLEKAHEKLSALS